MVTSFVSAKTVNKTSSYKIKYFSMIKKKNLPVSYQSYHMPN